MFNLIELAVWGRKSKTYKHLVNGKRTRKQPKSRIVLNERAWLRLYGKLFTELPHDEAISVLNTIKQYAK
jgi:hypothetical protein